MGGDAEVNSIGGIIKPQGICPIVLDLEGDMGKIHNLNFKNVYYFSGAPKIVITPQKWSLYRGEVDIGRQGTYIKVMGKWSILVWNNGKLKRTIVSSTGCALPETFINQG